MARGTEGTRQRGAGGSGVPAALGRLRSRRALGCSQRRGAAACGRRLQAGIPRSARDAWSRSWHKLPTGGTVLGTQLGSLPASQAGAQPKSQPQHLSHILPPPPAQLGTPGSPRPAPSAGAELGHGAPLPSVGQSTTTPWDPKPPPTGQSRPAAAARAAQGGRVPTGCPLLPQGCSSSRPSSCTSKRAVAARRGWCATAGSSTSTSGRPRTWRRKR